MRNAIILLAIWFLLWLVAPIALARMLFAIFTAPDKAWLIAVTFDKLGNVASNGDPNQTISYRPRSHGRRAPVGLRPMQVAGRPRYQPLPERLIG